MTTPNKRFIGILAAAAIMLLIPFALRFPWGAFDFIAAGVLLFGAGIALELALRLITKWEYRVAACVAILIAVALLWAELAVGIFRSPIAGS
jgi:hypothetical protein